MPSIIAVKCAESVEGAKELKTLLAPFASPYCVKRGLEKVKILDAKSSR